MISPLLIAKVPRRATSNAGGANAIATVAIPHQTIAPEGSRSMGTLVASHTTSNAPPQPETTADNKFTALGALVDLRPEPVRKDRTPNPANCGFRKATESHPQKQ